MANLFDLVKIKSGNYHAWSYNQNDQPYPMCLKQDLVGTVIGSMNDDDGDYYGLAEYWLQHEMEFMEGLGRSQYWRPSELYLVQTPEGLVITLRVRVIQKANPGADKTKKCKGEAMDKAFAKVASLIAEDVKMMEAAGMKKDIINHMKKKYRL